MNGSSGTDHVTRQLAEDTIQLNKNKPRPKGRHRNINFVQVTFHNVEPSSDASSQDEEENVDQNGRVFQMDFQTSTTQSNVPSTKVPLFHWKFKTGSKNQPPSKVTKPAQQMVRTSYKSNMFSAKDMKSVSVPLSNQVNHLIPPCLVTPHRKVIRTSISIQELLNE